MNNSTAIHRQATSEDDFLAAVRKLADCWGARFIPSDNPTNDEN